MLLILRDGNNKDHDDKSVPTSIAWHWYCAAWSSHWTRPMHLVQIACFSSQFGAEVLIADVHARLLRLLSKV
jgi:hypothetical protein